MAPTTDSNVDDSFQPMDRRSRAQAVYVRKPDQACAMGWAERARWQVMGVFGFPGGGRATAAEQEETTNNKNKNIATNNPSTKVQYRLEAAHHRGLKKKRSLLARLFGCLGLGFSQPQGGLAVGGVNPRNQKLALYLHWMFRVSFLFLFAVMCVGFFGLVILFSGFITIAGKLDSGCVNIGGEPFATVGSSFANAFSVSWVTFSTVGYGNAYPAPGSDNDSDPANCFFINFICSLESLVGVFYSGFCGAILFGKVLRIQSQARVLFSDPVLIRYGPGLGDAAQQQDLDVERKGACPVLEFRIVNRLFNELGGEIMDANLNVVANIDADDSDPSSLHHANHANMSSERTQVSWDGGADADADDHSSDNETSCSDSASSTLQSDRSSANLQKLSALFNPVSSIIKLGERQTVDEDPASRLVSKHVFSKMTIEASDHPFFKRVWLARHVLDEHSPVLKAKVRQQIRRNGGKWPDRLNHYTAIRDSLEFNQILVSLNGVSNVSASDVYAQKIYDFADVYIGYQFVNILYRDSKNDELGVDLDVINDVREQIGGGAEPLMLE